MTYESLEMEANTLVVYNLNSQPSELYQLLYYFSKPHFCHKLPCARTTDCNKRARFSIIQNFPYYGFASSVNEVCFLHRMGPSSLLFRGSTVQTVIYFISPVSDVTDPSKRTVSFLTILHAQISDL